MIDAEFTCAFCGQINSTTVDPSGGRLQSYTEDCQTCCRPNALRIEIDPDSDPPVFIDSEREGDEI
jgi:hypothetical protein